MKIWFVILFLIVKVFCENSIVCYAKENVERFSKIYDTPEEIPEPEPEFTGSDGVCYELKNSEIEEIYVPERIEKTGSTLIYKGVGETEPIPRTADILVWDKDGRQNLKVRLPLLRTTYDKERWQKFRFRLIFHVYDADAYMLNGIAINASEALPELLKREAEISGLIGLKKENSRIFQYEWGGEPYFDNAGVLCRDVFGEGEKKVWDCSALYEGEITVPGYDRYRMRNSYFRKPEEVSESLWEENVPVLENEKKEEIRDLVSRIIKVCLEVTVGIFFAVLAFLGFRLLLAFTHRLRKEKEKRDA